MTAPPPVDTVPQLPGDLPEGFKKETCVLTIAQFAIWQQVSESTVRAALGSMKGVIKRSRVWIRIQPQTFLDGSIKNK